MTAEELAKKLKKPRQTANGWEACCPTHDDENPSLSIADGKNGMPVFTCHGPCSNETVLSEFKARGWWPKTEPKARVGKAKIVKEYDYVDPATGEVKMQVVRMEPKDFRQRRPDGKGGWQWGAPAECRTLYNAPRVVAHNKVVLVVEGEKDVDNLAAIGIVATCNPGGAGKWSDAYSSILAGKDVIIVPDNDDAGEEHVRVVGGSLVGTAARVRVLRLPGLPPKGDISDWLANGGDRAELGRLLAGAEDYQPVGTLQPEEPGESPTRKHSNDNERHRGLPAGCPFKALGFNHGMYYYIGVGEQQVLELSASAHTVMNLLQLASLDWWERAFPSSGRSTAKFDAVTAADAMMDACRDRGIFVETDKRGRGAWWDDGRVIVHCGDMAYVDRQPEPLATIKSRYVYEQGARMPINIDDPLTLDETAKFVELMKMMAWSRPDYAILASGWCAIAPIGGVLNWRPHIWLTGGRGSGKSHVMTQVIKVILGDFHLYIVGASTEAGIRQTLGSDAIPVLFGLVTVLCRSPISLCHLGLECERADAAQI